MCISTHSRYIAEVSSRASDNEASFSLKGCLLLATPSLADGTFDRSVIFIAEHTSEDGALGIILNQPTSETVSDVLPDQEYSPLHQLTIHKGGPLSPEALIFSSISGSPTETLTVDLQLTPNQALELIPAKNQIIRATRGYSAWSPGQLERELVQNTWITSKAPVDLTDPTALPHDLSLWKNLLARISPYHHLISHAPKTPFLN